MCNGKIEDFPLFKRCIVFCLVNECTSRVKVKISKYINKQSRCDQNMQRPKCSCQYILNGKKLKGI